MKETEIYEMLKGVDLSLAELTAKLKRLEELEKQEKTRAQNLAVKCILNLTKQHKKELERVRKETAKKFAKELRNFIYLCDDLNLDADTYEKISNKMNEITEQCGVEIKGE